MDEMQATDDMRLLHQNIKGRVMFVQPVGEFISATD
jgi:hypothetical protein